MKIARFVLIALAVVVALALVPKASACQSAYVFSQWDTPAATYNYTILGASGSVVTSFPQVIGRFWQQGNRAAGNEGNNDASKWLLNYPGDAPEKRYIFGNMFNGETLCPAGPMVILVQAPSTDGKSSTFAVGVTPQNLAAAIVWNYSTVDLPEWDAVTVPHPGISVVTKTGSVVTYNATFPDLTGGQHPTGSNLVTGYRLMRSAAAGVPSGVDVGRGAAAWTLVGRVAAGGSLTGQTFDCASIGAGQDLFLATQVEFDNGQFFGDYVGASVQVKCNSTQANPQFHKIEKKAPK